MSNKLDTTTKLEVEWLRELMKQISEYAERAYWEGRSQLDAIPNWTHGDDTPVFPLIHISKRLHEYLGLHEYLTSDEPIRKKATLDPKSFPPDWKQKP